MSSILGSNKIDTLPTKIKARIDELLLNNTPINTTIHKVVSEFNCKLDWKTVAKYKDKLFKELNETEDSNVQEIISDDSSQEEIKMVQVVSNKKDLLEKLIADSYQRLQEIRKMNKRRYDPKWESLVGNYIESIRKLVETITDLDKEFDNDTGKIDNIVKSHLSKLLKCMYETVKVVCPEKINEFKETFSLKYKQENKQLENKNATTN